MKNLLIYIGPEKKFSPEHEALTKIQIDNSLGLGWKLEDIILATDFAWEYHGVKTYVLPEGDYRALDGNRSSKIPVVNQLFKDGVIKPGEVYWFHDHDAFQLEPITNFQLGSDVAVFTDHGNFSKLWNAGSFFFNSRAKDLFLLIGKTMKERHLTEQYALTYLWDAGVVEKRLMNSTYNLGIYRLAENVSKADKPLLVAHFHPAKPRHMRLYQNLLSERLKALFRQYHYA